MLVGNEASLYQVKRTANIDLSCPTLKAKWEEFRNGKLRWLACTYTTPKIISYLQSDCSSNLNSLQELLENSDDKVLYGVFSAKIGGIIRWVFYSFIGDKVSGMNRAKVSLHKSGISNYFTGIISSISLSESDDVQEENLVAHLNASGGFEKSSIKFEFPFNDNQTDGVELTNGTEKHNVESRFIDDLKLLIFPSDAKPTEYLLNETRKGDSCQGSKTCDADFILWSNIAEHAPASLYDGIQNSGQGSLDFLVPSPDSHEVMSDELPLCLQQYVSFISRKDSSIPLSVVARSSNPNTSDTNEESLMGESDGNENSPEDQEYQYDPLPNVTDILQIRAYIAKCSQNMDNFLSNDGKQFLEGLWDKRHKDDAEMIELSASTISSGNTLFFILIIDCILTSISQVSAQLVIEGEVDVKTEKK